MADDLTITAAGQRLGGWLTTRVTRGCERLPSEFDIALTERHPGQVADLAVKPGDPCRARLGDDPVIAGCVDRLQPSINARRHAPRVQGRGKSADPVDRSAGIDTGGKPTGMSKKMLTLPDLATGLAKPFSVSISSLTGDRLSSASRATPARSRATGPTATWCSRTSTMASGFAQGVNVQSAMANFTLDERYSVYQPSLMSVDSFHDTASGRFPPRPTLDQGVRTSASSDATATSSGRNQAPA